MLRLFNIGLIALIVGVAAWTFQIKHEAELSEDEIARLERAIKLENETIDLLKADWAHLNDPARIQAIVERFSEQLDLQQLQVEQIITLDELPMRSPSQPDDLIADKIDVMDDTTTGSVDTSKVAQ